MESNPTPEEAPGPQAVQPQDVKRYLKNLEAERNATALCTRLAESESNPDLATLDRRLADTESQHAVFWEEKLVAAGAAITLMTGRNALYAGLRQVLFGMAAAAVTFGVGHVIGVNVAG